MSRKFVDQYFSEIFPNKSRVILGTHVIPVDLSSIAEMAYEKRPRLSNDLPIFSPTWNNVWYEWRYPSNFKKKFGHALAGAGVLETMTTDHDRMKEIIIDLEHHEYIERNVTEYRLQKFEALSHLSDVKWMVVADYFLFYSATNVVRPCAEHSRLFEFVKPDGSLINNAWILPSVSNYGHLCYPDTQTTMSVKDADKWIEGTHPWLFSPKYLGMQFLNCKNVELSDDVTSNIPRKKRKKNKKPKITFKTLTVYPITRVSNKTNRGTGIQKATHITRGYQADHRKHGLFGNPALKGIYWVPMHIRGNKKHGIIIKDYKVKERKRETSEVPK
jgi:hypothetical protein